MERLHISPFFLLPNSIFQQIGLNSTFYTIFSTRGSPVAGDERSHYPSSSRPSFFNFFNLQCSLTWKKNRKKGTFCTSSFAEVRGSGYKVNTPLPPPFHPCWGNSRGWKNLVQSASIIPPLSCKNIPRCTQHCTWPKVHNSNSSLLKPIVAKQEKQVTLFYISLSIELHSRSLSPPPRTWECVGSAVLFIILALEVKTSYLLALSLNHNLQQFISSSTTAHIFDPQNMLVQQF